MTEERKIVTLDDLHRRHIDRHLVKLSEWYRHLTSLSGAGLTLLVSLQNNYVSPSSQGLILLQACWIALASATLLGLLVHFSEVQNPLDAADNLAEERKKYGDKETANRIIQRNGARMNQRWYFQFALRALPWAISTGVVCLCWFAVLNARPT